MKTTTHSYEGHIHRSQHFGLERNVLAMIQSVGEDRHDLVDRFLSLHGWERAFFLGDEPQERAENRPEVGESGGVGSVRLQQT